MLRYWIILFAAVIISSASQLLLKRGAKIKHDSIIKEYLNRWVISGYFLMIISTLCVIFAYRGVDYKNGPIIESLGFIIIMIFSNIFFKEALTTKKMIGMGCIILGIAIFYI